MNKIEKNCHNLSTVDWTFCIILEIIENAIFMKLIAINNNEIFHVKGKEFLSTINMPTIGGIVWIFFQINVHSNN